MATKTFKIGLSNTDKQNMAQDVYERLLELTFQEYDTTEDYSVGDFVVYNDQLYKCIGATSGAWDSTKWQLATLNDLVTDIESAVAFVNDKANVDGNYPTMTVGVADQLSPYDDESGDDQDEPFSFQATGTGNGSQPDFSTGSIALMKEKQGNTVVVNQLVNLSDTASTTWGNGAGTYSISSGVITVNVNTSESTVSKIIISLGLALKGGHKYLAIAQGLSDNSKIFLYAGSTNQFVTLNAITAVANDGTFSLNYYSSGGVAEAETYTFRLYVIDLTQWFNGDIPQDLLDNPDHFFRYYQGSLAYKTGELVNADGRYIKCIGMNQWDEEWELGYINISTGQPASTNSEIRSKNFYKCIPNADYYFKSNAGRIYWYDADKNYIGASSTNNAIIKFPVNAHYFKLAGGSGYGTTYNNDISINIYYEDENRCLTYEPYEVLTNNDTGTETLRSAGSVKDYKTPDGTIHRLVGVVNLGSLTYTYVSGDNPYFYSSVITGKKLGLGNLVCSKYVCQPVSIASMSDKSIRGDNSGGYIYIKDSGYSDAVAFKTAMSGVYLFYELAEPTTEQGTTFSENLVIDDFGSMDFGGTNGVPQGNLIFYPVDYKAFIDTLYDYTDGTPSNIALKSDLPTAPQTWAESLPGYDATKTQVLKNVEGTLTWVDDE